MQAYHNDPKLKEKIINQLQIHYDHDQIVQGVYWESGKGCALGCIMQRDNSNNIHAEMQAELGVPQPLPRLIDRIFEGLNNKIAKEFPIKIMRAIPVGKDLSTVWLQFVVWLLIDEEHGVIKYAKNYKVKYSINKVATLYERKIKGDIVEKQEWQEATDAYAAADAAAYAAAAYADSYAAYADADADDADAAAAYAYAADAYAAADAADAYAAAADAAALRENHYEIMADKLIELVS